MLKSRYLRVLLLDTEAQTRNSYIILAIRDALVRNPHVQAVHVGTLGGAVADFRAQGCNFFLAFGSAATQAPILSRLCCLASQSVLWTTEDPYDLASNVRHSHWFSAVYSNDSGSIPAYGGRARHLPLAASRLLQDYNVIEEDHLYRYDLLFVGTGWPNRVDDLRQVIAGLPTKTRCKIGLSGNQYLPVEDLDANLHWTNWRTSNPNFARLANMSRVTLGLERRFTSSELDVASGVTPPPRLFEVALAGGYQVFRSDNTEIARYYNPATEVALCGSLDEVTEEIRWALENPQERIGKALAARERTCREHLYDHRVARLLDDAMADYDTPGHPRSAATALRRTTRDVLIVTHNLMHHKPGGGVEVYQEVLRLLGPDYRIHYLFPDNAGATTTFVVLHPGGDVVRYELAHRVGDTLLHDVEAEQVFAKILFNFNIDVVHFQHLLHFPLSLPLIAKACGIPTVFTIHDHYLICSRYNLLDYRGTFCDPATLSVTSCDACLDAAGGTPHGSQTRRRNFIRQIVRAVDAVVANTPASLAYFRTIYPESPLQAGHVIEMCLPTTPPTANRRPPAGNGAQTLRVAIPGNFTDEKGADQVVRLLNLLREDPIRFTIFGKLNEKFARIFDALALPNVSVLGGYSVDEVFTLLSWQDMSLHLSIWPETYVITLSEAWASGLVPIVSRLGALEERVSDGVDGYVVNPFDIGRVADILRAMIDDRDTYERMRNSILQKRLQTPLAHITELQLLYDRLISQSAVPHLVSNLREYSGFNISLSSLGLRTNTARWDSAANDWDEPISLGETLEGLKTHFSSEAFDDIPLQYRHLPINSTDEGDEKGHCCIDVLSVNDVESESGVAAVQAGQPEVLRITGWAHEPGYGRAIERFLCVHSGALRRVYWAKAMERPGVADYFGDASALSCGFDIMFPTVGFQPGHYWIDVIVIYDGVIVKFERRARVDVFGHAKFLRRTSRQKDVYAPADVLPAIYDELPNTSLALAEPGTILTIIKFEMNETIQGINVTEASARVFDLHLEGWILHARSGAPMAVFCRLRSMARAVVVQGVTVRLPGLLRKVADKLACEGGFQFHIKEIALWPGPCALDLIQVYPDRIVEITGIQELEIERLGTRSKQEEAVLTP